MHMVKRSSCWIPLFGFAIFSTLFGFTRREVQHAPYSALNPAASHGTAGVHIDFVNNEGKPATQMYVYGDRIRIESGNSRGNGVIYNAAAHTMTLLMPIRKSYMVLDRKSAAQLGDRLAVAQQQMQAEMAKLPKAQRAMMEKMMSKSGAGSSHPKIEIKDLKTTETIDGYRCHDQQVITDGVPNLKMCVAPVNSLHLPAAALATLKSMRQDMANIMSNLGPMAQAYSTMGSPHGFAIKREVPHHEGFKLVTRTETLKSISDVTPPASLFRVPADYTRTSMQQMMQGMHSN